MASCLKAAPFLRGFAQPLTQIDALNIMSYGLYQNLLLGSHDSIIQNLCTNNVTSFTYEGNLITQVYWNDRSQVAHKLKQSVIYSSNPQIGSPITASGDAHNNMVKEIKNINSINSTDLDKYVSFISQKQYGKALRTACNSCKSIDKDKGVFELIKVILSYKEKLSININEQNSENKAAIDYAALQGNKEVYNLLIAHGGLDRGNAKNVLEESLKKISKDTKPATQFSQNQ